MAAYVEESDLPVILVALYRLRVPAPEVVTNLETLSFL